MQEVDWTRPTAFVLGNEREGVSDTAVALADATAIIPMAGEQAAPHSLAVHGCRRDGTPQLGQAGIDVPGTQQLPHLPSQALITRVFAETSTVGCRPY